MEHQRHSENIKKQLKKINTHRKHHCLLKKIHLGIRFIINSNRIQKKRNIFKLMKRNNRKSRILYPAK